MKSIELLESKIERLKKSQAEAEKLLEEKTRQLYEVNQSLEKQIAERTKEISAARDEAIRANKAKSQFLANMSHEIRTPLNGIIGLISLLKGSELDSVQADQVETIHISGNLLLGIINDLLEFSKIEAGKVQLALNEFEPLKVVETIADTLSYQIYSKGLECAVYVDDDVPEKIKSDEGKIRQILLNLVGNATKFTPTGEIEIILSTKLDEKENKFIQFSVRDTGVGIPPEKIDLIFKPFEQADLSDTRKYGGTGLGLTISKYLALQLGGQLTVESIESQGTTFSFSVPVDSFNSAELEKVQFDQPVKILFKNKTVQANIIRRLQSWGIDCTALESWQQIEKDQKTFFILEDQFVDNNKDNFDKLKQLNQVVIAAKPQYIVENQSQTKNSKISFLRKPIHRGELLKLFKPVTVCQAEVENSQPLASKESARILLAEDNLINQKVAGSMLDLQNISYLIANNGKEAVEIVESGEKFSLILMDCQMPEMDGFEATLAIRKINPDIPIIAMTANAFRQTKEKCFEVGMSDFMTKPVTVDGLKKYLEKYLAS